MREQDGAARRPPPLPELFLLASLPLPVRAGLSLLAVVLAVGWGFAALALHQMELSLRSAGHLLNPIANLFAGGSSAYTAWPGWAAALLFGLSGLRLRRGALEPPGGRRPSERSAADLRSGLRREYRWARMVLLAVSLLALADVARVGVSWVAWLTGVSTAGDGLGWAALEAAGLAAAGAALIGWLLGFRRQLLRVGAIAPPQPRRRGRHRRLRFAGRPRNRRPPRG